MIQQYRTGLAAMLCFGALSSGLFAQESTNPNSRAGEFSKVGAGSGNFLLMPVGARGMAMGSAYSAIADDPSALYWNPAGITQGPGATAAYSYTRLFAGMGHNFAGGTFAISDAYKVGISATTFSSGDIDITTAFADKGTGATYSVRDLAFGLSLAGQLTEQFSFGVTGKFVSLGIYDLTASGIAFDFGTLYRPGILGMRIAFGVQNLSAPFKYTGPGLVHSGQINSQSGQQEPDAELEANEATLPLTFRAGISSDVLEGNDMHALLVAAEFTTTATSNEGVGIGAEYVWNKTIAARVGYQFGAPNAFGITGGIGVKYDTGNFYGQLDYGIKPHETLGLINQITASIRFQ
jgi:hypothetical protein